MNNITDAIIPLFEDEKKGIAIDPFLCKSQLGKLKLINYPNFKYWEDEIWIRDKNDKENMKSVRFIEIINLSENMIKEFINSVNDLLQNESITVAEAIDKIIDLFKKVKFKKEIAQELFGDLGEALFILKSFEQGYDVMKYLRTYDEGLYDFNLGKFAFEVKSTSPEKNEFVVSDEQLQQIKNKKIVIVKFKKVTGHTTILDVYDLISKKYGTLPDLLVEKQKHWLSVQSECQANAKNDLISDYSVILENVEINSFKEHKLPEYQIINKNACNKIMFHISCTKSELDHIKEFYDWFEKNK